MGNCQHVFILEIDIISMNLKHVLSRAWRDHSGVQNAASCPGRVSGCSCSFQYP